MKKSKYLFIIAAAVIALLLGCLFLFSGGEDTAPSTKPTGDPANTGFPTTPSATSGNAGNDPTQATTNPNTYQTTPSSTNPTAPTGTLVQIKPGVTALQVEKDPNEIIDRTPGFSTTHPEYQVSDQYNPNFSSEGKIFRNDKVITIDIKDPLENCVHKISFGYITGYCNRWLYLNPKVESPISDEPFLFHFTDCVNGGYIANYSETVEDYTSLYGYQMKRTVDRVQIASYTNPKNPGTVWYSQAPITGPRYVDCLVLSPAGDYIASIRITIEKAEDGTVSITDLTNRNLNQSNENTPYTEREIEYILDYANQIADDSSLIQMDFFSSNNTLNFTAEKTIIDIRNKDNGFYYDQFVPKAANQKNNCGVYESNITPTLAITCRHYASKRAFTIYITVLAEPTATSHGSYQYIGRDYTQYLRIEDLIKAGYTGLDK